MPEYNPGLERAKYYADVLKGLNKFGIGDNPIEGVQVPDLNTYHAQNVPYVIGRNNELLRAEYQPLAQKINRTFNPIKMASSIGLGLVENVGYLGALLYNRDGDYDNALTRLAKSGREALDREGSALIGGGQSYRKRPDEVFDLSDPAWWLQHGSSLVESIGEFYLTGAGVGKIFSSAARGLSRQVTKGIVATAGRQSQAGAIHRASVRTGQAFANLSTAGVLAYTEGAMSASQVFQDVKDHWIREGSTLEEAASKAARSAASVTRTNTAINTLLNVTGISPMFRSTRHLEKFKQSGLVRGANEATETYLTRLQKGIVEGAYEPNVARTVKRLGFEALQEGIEEDVNLYAESKGRILGGLEEGSLGLKGFLASAFTEEGALNFMLGAVGGLGQTMAVDGVPAYKTPILDSEGRKINKKDKDGNVIEGKFETSYKSLRQLRNDDKIQESVMYAKNLVGDLERIQSANKELREVVSNDSLGAEEKRAKIKELTDKAFSLSMLKSLRDGTHDNLIQTYKEIQRLDNSKDLGEEFENENKSRIEELEGTIASSPQQDGETLSLSERAAKEGEQAQPDEAAVEVAKAREELDDINKTIKRLSGITEATQSGFALDTEDNSYVDKAKYIEDDIKDRAKEFDRLTALYDYGEAKTHGYVDRAIELYGYAKDAKAQVADIDSQINEFNERVKRANSELSYTDDTLVDVRNAEAERESLVEAVKERQADHKALLEAVNKKDSDVLDRLMVKYNSKSAQEVSDAISIDVETIEGKFEAVDKNLEDLFESYKTSNYDSLPKDINSETGVETVNDEKARRRLSKALSDQFGEETTLPILHKHKQLSEAEAKRLSSLYEKLLTSKGRNEFVKGSKEAWSNLMTAVDEMEEARKEAKLLYEEIQERINNKESIPPAITPADIEARAARVESMGFNRQVRIELDSKRKELKAINKTIFDKKSKLASLKEYLDGANKELGASDKRIKKRETFRKKYGRALEVANTVTARIRTLEEEVNRLEVVAADTEHELQYLERNVFRNADISSVDALMDYSVKVRADLNKSLEDIKNIKSSIENVKEFTSMVIEAVRDALSRMSSVPQARFDHVFEAYMRKTMEKKGIEPSVSLVTLNNEVNTLLDELELKEKVLEGYEIQLAVMQTRINRLNSEVRFLDNLLDRLVDPEFYDRIDRRVDAINRGAKPIIQKTNARRIEHSGPPPKSTPNIETSESSNAENVQSQEDTPVATDPDEGSPLPPSSAPLPEATNPPNSKSVLIDEATNLAREIASILRSDSSHLPFFSSRVLHFPSDSGFAEVLGKFRKMVNLLQDAGGDINNWRGLAEWMSSVVGKEAFAEIYPSLLNAYNMVVRSNQGLSPISDTYMEVFKTSGPVILSEGQFLTPSLEQIAADREALQRAVTTNNLEFKPVRDGTLLRSVDSATMVAYRSVTFDEIRDEQGSLIAKRTNSDELNPNVSTKLFRQKAITKGDEIVIRLATPNDNLDVNTLKQIKMYERDAMNIPMVIEHKGEVIGYLHKMDWMTNENVVPLLYTPDGEPIDNLARQQGRLKSIRERAIRGPLTAYVKNISLGFLSFDSQGLERKGNEVFGDKPIEFAVARNNKLMEGRDMALRTPIVNTSPEFVNSAVYAILPSPNGKNLAYRMNTNTLEEESIDTIINVIEAALLKKEDVKDRVLKEFGINIFTEEGLEDFVNLFVHSSSFNSLDPAIAGEEYYYFNTTKKSGEFLIAFALAGNRPEFVNAKNFKATRDQTKQLLKAHLRKMYAKVSLSKMKEGFKLPVVMDSGEVTSKNFDSYSDYIKTVVSTDLNPIDIGDGEVSYFVQPSYSFTFQKPNESGNDVVRDEREREVTRDATVDERKASTIDNDKKKEVQAELQGLKNDLAGLDRIVALMASYNESKDEEVRGEIIRTQDELSDVISNYDSNSNSPLIARAVVKAKIEHKLETLKLIDNQQESAKSSASKQSVEDRLNRRSSPPSNVEVASSGVVETFTTTDGIDIDIDISPSDDETLHKPYFPSTRPEIRRDQSIEDGESDLIDEKEAQKVIDYLSKKYGIEAAIKEMPRVGARGESTFTRFGDINISAFRQPLYEGRVYKKTIFHEFLHPFVNILQVSNPSLYDEIYEKAKEVNSVEKFADVDHYVESERKEELVVRYLDRLSREESVPSILQRFMEWLSNFLFSNKKNNYSDLEELSSNTTVEELFEVFKNYGNIQDDYKAVVTRKRLEQEKSTYTELLTAEESAVNIVIRHELEMIDSVLKRFDKVSPNKISVGEVVEEEVKLGLRHNKVKDGRPYKNYKLIIVDTDVQYKAMLEKVRKIRNKLDSENSPLIPEVRRALPTEGVRDKSFYYRIGLRPRSSSGETLHLPSLSPESKDQLLGRLSDVLPTVMDADREMSEAVDTIAGLVYKTFIKKRNEAEAKGDFKAIRAKGIIQGIKKDFEKFQEKAPKLKRILADWDVVVKSALRKLERSSIIEIGYLENEDFDTGLEDAQDSVVQFMNFRDDRTLRTDGKKSLARGIKQFLYFIETDERTSFGTKKHLSFDYVYNNLVNILQDAGPDFESMVKAMKRHENTFDFIKPVLNALEAAPQEVINGFVSGLSLRYTNMKRLRVTEEGDRIDTTLESIDTHSISKALREQWVNNLDNSEYAMTVTDYIRRAKKGLFNLSESDIANLSDLEFELGGKTIIPPEYKDKLRGDYIHLDLGNDKAIADFFTGIGVTMTPSQVSLIRQSFDSPEAKFFKSDTFEALFKKGEFKRMMSEIMFFQPGIRNNLTVIKNPLRNNTSVKRLSLFFAKYEAVSHTNSMRDGKGNTIYAYTQGKYVIDRVKALQSTDLAKTLLKNPFQQNSDMLRRIATEPEYAGRFNYFTFDALSHTGGRGGLKVTEMSDRQLEIARLNMLTGNGNVREAGGVREIMSSYMLPSIAGKTTVIGIEATSRDIRVDQSGMISVQEMDILYKGVEAEINRIRHYNNLKSKDLLSEVNNKQFQEGGGKFIVFQELNKENIPEESPLFEIWEGGNVRADKKDLIIQEYLFPLVKQLIEDKVSEWKELGVVETTYEEMPSNPFLSTQVNSLKLISTPFTEKVIRRKFEGDMTEDQKINAIASYMVFNYMDFNFNSFQSIIGDPAFYWKSDVSGTYSNISKRLALMLAPGISLSQSKEGFDKYLQVFAEDLVGVSNQIEKIVEVLDNKKLNSKDKSILSKGRLSNEDKSYLSKRFPVSHPYMNIETTDAQEVTTWKEHLDVMYRQGYITEAQFNALSDKFKNNLELTPTELKGIFNPIKPVYAGTNNMSSLGVEEVIYIKSSSFPLIPQLVNGTPMQPVMEAMEKLQSESGKNVRLVYSTGAKLGGPLKPVDFWGDEKDGSVRSEFNFEGSYKELDRSNFRIQMPTPYEDNKSKINDGSQKRKLLFSNLLEVEGFEYEGKSYTGAELQSILMEKYGTVFKNKQDLLFSEIQYNPKTNKFNVSALSKMLEKEARARGYNINAIKALSTEYDANKGEFSFRADLWLSPVNRKTEEFVVSVMDQRLRKLTTAGRSLILASESGLITTKSFEEAFPIINRGVTFIQGFNPAEGLGPNDIILPAKFFDGFGNQLDINNYITDGELDLDKFPKELLEVIGYRIPTADLNSTRNLRVVGFLDSSLGDMVIASKDLIVQMGSDFDVDKLYASMMKAFVDSSGQLKVLDRANLSEYVELASSVELEDGDTAKENLLIKSIRKPRIQLEADIDLAYNDIHKIHLSVYNNQALEVQARLLRPTSYGEMEALKEEIVGAENMLSYRILTSDSYHRKAFSDSMSAEKSIGVFALDNTFNSSVQGKDIQMLEPSTGLPISFEMLGHKSSDLSSIRRFDGGYKSDTMAAFVQTAVDDGNLQIIGALNINDNTYDSIRILKQLGFNEREIIYFINQPIIKAMTSRMSRLAEENNGFVTDEVIDRASRLAASSMRLGKDAAGKLSMSDLEGSIKEGAEYPNFKAIQNTVLNKFLFLTDKGKKLASVQKDINADSRQIGRDFLDVLVSVEAIQKLPFNNNFSNLGSLLGDTSSKPKEGFIQIDDSLYIKPKTIHGLASIYGRVTSLDVMRSQFPYELESIAQTFEEVGMMGRNRSLNVDQRRVVLNSIKAMLFADYTNPIFDGERIETLRERIFKDDIETYTEKEGELTNFKIRFKRLSLARRIEALRLRGEFPNSFFNALSMNFGNKVKPSLVIFNGEVAEEADENRFFSSLINALTYTSHDKELQKEVNDIALDLVKMTLLSGSGRSLFSLSRFIPIDLLIDGGFFRHIRNTAQLDNIENYGGVRNSVHSIATAYDKSDFTRNAFQHAPYLATIISPEDFKQRAKTNKKGKNFSSFVIDEVEGEEHDAFRSYIVTEGNESSALPVPFISVKTNSTDKGWRLFEYAGDRYVEIPVKGSRFIQEAHLGNTMSPSLYDTNNPGSSKETNVENVPMDRPPSEESLNTLEQDILNRQEKGGEDIGEELHFPVGGSQPINKLRSIRPSGRTVTTEQILEKGSPDTSGIQTLLNENLDNAVSSFLSRAVSGLKLNLTIGAGAVNYIRRASGDVNKATININRGPKDVMLQSLNHELTHAVIGEGIKTALDYIRTEDKTGLKKPTDEQLVALNRLVRLKKTVYDKVKKGEIKGLSFETLQEVERIYLNFREFGSEVLSLEEMNFLEDNLGKYYGLISSEEASDNFSIGLEEFITMAMTNPDFQETLNNIQYSESKTLLDKLVELMLEFLKDFTIVKSDGTQLAVKDDSALLSALGNTLKLSKDKTKSKDTKIEDIQPKTEAEQQLNTEFDKVLHLPTTYSRYKSLIERRKNTISRIERALPLEKEPTEIARLEASKAKLEGQIDMLEKSGSLRMTKDIATTDMSIVKDIIGRDNPSFAELEIAEEIIALWEKALDVLFSPSELELIDGERSPNVQLFDNIVSQAGSYRGILDAIYRKKVSQNAGTVLGRNISENSLIKLKEVSWAKSRVLDLSHFDNPITSYMDKLNRTASANADAEINRKVKKIDSMMNNLPPNLRNFEWFLQEDSRGKHTGNAVGRYSQNFFYTKGKLLRAAEEDNKKWKEYYDWKSENEVVIDPSRMFKESTDSDGNTVYVLDIDPSYKRDIINKFGEKLYDKIEGEMITKMEQYSSAHDAARDVFFEGESTTKAQDYNVWLAENSPFLYYNNTVSNTKRKINGRFIQQKGYKYTMEIPIQKWHDDKFKAIEGNEQMLEFYEFVMGTLHDIYSYLPASKRSKLQSNTLPVLMQNFADLTKGREGQAAFSYLGDKVKKYITTETEDGTIYTLTDPTTGKEEKTLPVYMLNFDSLVSKEYNIKLDLYAANLDISTGEISKDKKEEIKQEAIDEVNGRRSFDVGRILKAFAATGVAYKHKAKIETPLKVAYKVINNALEVQLSANKEEKTDRNGEAHPIKGGLNNLKQAVDYFMEAFTGDKRAEEGKSKKKLLSREEKKVKSALNSQLVRLTAKKDKGEITNTEFDKSQIEIKSRIQDLGRNIVASRVGDTFLQYNQLLGMGWNFFTAITNLGFGWVSNMIHAAGGEDFTVGNYMKAKRIMTHSFISSMANFSSLDSFATTPTGKKITNLVANLSIMPEINEANYSNSSSHRAGKGLKKLYPYELQRRSEFMIRGEMMVAIMLNEKVKLDSGKEISMWQGFNEKGEWNSKDYGPQPDLDITEDGLGSRIMKTKLRIDQLGKELHGNYDFRSPLLAKKTFIGRALFQFRSWIPEGIESRFGSEKYDDLLERTRKGRYRSVFAVLEDGNGDTLPLLEGPKLLIANMVRLVSFNTMFKNAGENLKDVDKANIKKTAMEALILMAVFATNMLFKGLDDDDEERKEALNYILNQGFRLQKDINFYYSPRSFEDITKNSIPLSSVITNTADWFRAAGDYLNGDDEYKSGIYAGSSKLLRKTGRMLPFGTQIYRNLAATKQVFE